MSSIRVNYVYVNDVNAPYGAHIQLISTTSGDSFPLGPVSPDGEAYFALDTLGLSAGQTFTVTLQADHGGAAADTTVITYDPGVTPQTAAKYSGDGSLKNPTFGYIGTGPGPTPPPPPTVAIKVDTIYVDNSKAPYKAFIQLVHRISRDVFPLGSIGSDSTSWYSLKGVEGLLPLQEFTVTIQTDQGGAAADTTVITYDPTSAFAAAFSSAGSLKQPTFHYTSIIPDPTPRPPSLAIKVGSVVLDDSLEYFSSTILAIDTTSKKSHTLGSGIKGGRHSFSLEGKFTPGQTFIVNLQPEDSQYKLMATQTVITYDPSASAAASYALQLNRFGPEFDYWPCGFQ